MSGLRSASTAAGASRHRRNVARPSHRHTRSADIPSPTRIVSESLPLTVSQDEPVTLITTFRLPDHAPVDRFVWLWTEIGRGMAGQPGFVSACLYRRAAGSARAEYIHVAHWRHVELMTNARSDPEIRRLEGEVDQLVVKRHHVICRACTEELLPVARHPPR